MTARLDDGQELSGLNEVFIGHASHQSARYQLTTPDGRAERHSSSGLIVSTGTGATGWCASIALERGGRALPAPTDPRLAWFVREAWPSPITGTSLTEGALEAGERLRVTVASDQLVVFGDGMEDDRLTASWGQEITVQLGERPLRLVGQEFRLAPPAAGQSDRRAPARNRVSERGNGHTDKSRVTHVLAAVAKASELASSPRRSSARITRDRRSGPVIWGETLKTSGTAAAVLLPAAGPLLTSVPASAGT